MRHTAETLLDAERLMTAPSLDDLRRRIDEIDDRIHDLLMERTAITAPFAAMKAREDESGAPAYGKMRPAREIQILRRLMARHEGALPREAVVKIWRDLILANLRLQGPLDIHMLGAGHALTGLAAHHFGAYGSAVQHASLPALIAALSDPAHPHVLGLVARADALDTEQHGPWWAHLMPSGARAPKVIARAPVLAGMAFPDSFVLGRVPLAPSGADTSLIALILQEAPPEAVLTAILSDAGVSGDMLAHAPSQNGHHILLEADGFIAPEDERLEALREAAGSMLRHAALAGVMPEQV